mgnify:CR=1 FL=1
MARAPMPSEGSPAAAARGQAAAEKSAIRFSQRWLVLLLVVMLVLFLTMTRIFFVPVVVAAVFTTLTYPLQDRMVRLVRGRRGLAALLSCATVLLLVLIPAYLAMTRVAIEMRALYASNEERILAALLHLSQQVDRASTEGLAGVLPVPSWAPPLRLESINWQDLLSSLGNTLGAWISGTSQGALQVVASLLVVLFTMFYFFRDGEAIVQRLRYLSPLEQRYEDLLIGRMVSTSRATLRATVIIGFIQGTLGALTLSIAGIQAPFLWGVAMWVLALFPLVGTWVVMYPIGIIELVQGHVRDGLLIIGMTALVISTIDNVIRPRLVGRRAGMHDLLVFFATIGGLATFGLLGAIVGPIVASLFVSLLEIYTLEFRSQLEHHDLGAAQGQAAEETAL